MSGLVGFLPETVIVALIPEAENLVGGIRMRFDAAAQLGLPAHVTIVAPFMSPDSITPAVLESLRNIVKGIPSFDYLFQQIARFPTTAYLAPESGSLFVALTEALAFEFPGFKPYRGLYSEIIPHLTLADSTAIGAESAISLLESAMREVAPIRGRCSGVSMFENSSGFWKEIHWFALGIPEGE